MDSDRSLAVQARMSWPLASTSAGSSGEVLSRTMYLLDVLPGSHASRLMHRSESIQARYSSPLKLARAGGFRLVAMAGTGAGALQLSGAMHPPFRSLARMPSDEALFRMGTAAWSTLEKAGPGNQANFTGLQGVERHRHRFHPSTGSR